MEAINENGSFKVEFSFEELIILHNSFNELCNNLRITDFQKITGASREELIIILDTFGISLLSIEKECEIERNDSF